MAKYKVTFSCGHTEEIQLSGPGAERERKLEYYSRSGDCSECRKDNKQAAIEELEVTDGLPALEGSEKQIAWARSIRASLIREAEEAQAGAEAKIESTIQGLNRPLADKEKSAIAISKRAYADVLAGLKSQQSAKWWIDNRIEFRYYEEVSKRKKELI